MILNHSFTFYFRYEPAKIGRDVVFAMLPNILESLELPKLTNDSISVTTMSSFKGAVDFTNKDQITLERKHFEKVLLEKNKTIASLKREVVFLRKELKRIRQSDNAPDSKKAKSGENGDEHPSDNESSEVIN